VNLDFDPTRGIPTDFIGETVEVAEASAVKIEIEYCEQ
jgi:hypothetical protein